MFLIPEFKDLTGQKFGRWTVIKRAESLINSGKPVTRWLCQCDCGSEPRVVIGASLLHNRSTSCGCLHKEKCAEFCKEHFSSHKEAKTRLYQIWAGMRKRCQNPNAYNYDNYGGRGISVCEEWNDYYAFRDWSLVNGYQDSLSIDRIDVNGNYQPDNCRWVTRDVQANNRRTNRILEMDGEFHTVAEWSKMYGINYKKLYKQVVTKKSSIKGHPTISLIKIIYQTQQSL